MSIKISILFISIGLSLIACKQQPVGDIREKFTLTDTMFQRITIDTVKESQVISELKFSGKITPEDNKVVQVFPIVSGYVTQLNATLGDYVEKGKVLAVIRSSDIADFEKQQRNAEADLLVSQKNLKAAQELFESKLNTERDVVSATKEVKNAEAELERINEVFSIYHVKKGSIYNVVAPISGFIIDKKINSDMQLPSGISESIFTIAQIDQVFVTANVYETDIAKLSTGMQAEVELLSYPGKKYTGKIDKILNVLDPETKTLKIRIRLPNPGFTLKPEMAAIVYITYPEETSLPAIPADAIVFDKSKNFLMVYHQKDSIETRSIETFKTTAGRSFISAGLKPGEQVIVKNALLVYEALND